MRATAAVMLLALFGVFVSEPVLARKYGVSSGVQRSFTGATGQRAPTPAATHHGSGHHHHGHGHHHHHSGVAFVGVGFGWPWYYPHYYPAYYPYPVAYPTEPVTYIEQNGAPAAEPVGWWYYCESSKGYYPYVKECPSGWQRVPALPPPPK